MGHGLRVPHSQPLLCHEEVLAVPLATELVVPCLTTLHPAPPTPQPSAECPLCPPPLQHSPYRCCGPFLVCNPHPNSSERKILKGKRHHL